MDQQLATTFRGPPARGGGLRARHPDAWFRPYIRSAIGGYHGKWIPLRQPARFHAWLRPLKDIKWVVYAKPPFGGPEYVLKYLARYTHRVAISNGRLLSLENGQVTFHWRGSKDNNPIKAMT